MFIMFKNMHVYNTWIAAVLADATIGIPFSVLILKNYFASIPKDLEEAAYLDGCNKFTAFLRILIPIAKPGVIVCAIFFVSLCLGRSCIRDDLYSGSGKKADYGRHF